MDLVKRLEQGDVFELLDLDNDPSFNNSGDWTSITPQESPVPLLVPTYNADAASNCSNSNSSSHLMILDPSPTASPEPSFGSEMHGYTESIALDLEEVLSYKESDYKAVKFRLSPPQKKDYVVSMDLDQDSLRRVPPKGNQSAQSVLLQIAQSTASPQELMECSETLQSAAFRALVRTGTDAKSDNVSDGMLSPMTPMTPSAAESMVNLYLSNHNQSEEKGDDTESQVTSPRTKQFINLYIEQNRSLNALVRFDRISVTASNEKTVLLQSRGLTSGSHEWSVQVWRSDVDLQGLLFCNFVTFGISDFGGILMSFWCRYAVCIGVDLLCFTTWFH